MSAPELDELLPALRDPDPAVRIAAAGALGALGRDGVPAIGPLFEACRDTDMYLRGEAIHSLGEIAGSLRTRPGTSGRSDFVAGLATVIGLLADPWWSVRCSAITFLQRLGPAAAPALPHLRAILTDEIPGLTEFPEGWGNATAVQFIREAAEEAVAAIDSTEA